ncbi:MAG: 50S ribosomal protein L11 methyltransferase [Bacteroidales bacterium]|nr:50S ribosomal protein L11 methyltransferase [Bacteroidales bacterium]
MNYIELTFSPLNDDKLQELLTAMLTTIGCDSFCEEEQSFKAYCPVEDYSEEALNDLLSEPKFVSVNLISAYPLEDKNWNEIWESNYEPVLIDNKCLIRAPFHHDLPSAEYELVIEPKMSFGTAHHETTSQMIQLLLKSDVKGCSVLDMGCGTGILAILASKMGATPVVAIDNDEWAYNNAIENIQLNGTEKVEVELGNADSIGDRKFDVIIANINRNILLNDMEAYAKSLNKSSRLMLSGFYVSDLEAIKKAAESCGLRFESNSATNQWVAALFVKD